MYVSTTYSTPERLVFDKEEKKLKKKKINFYVNPKKIPPPLEAKI